MPSSDVGPTSAHHRPSVISDGDQPSRRPRKRQIAKTIYEEAETANQRTHDISIGTVDLGVEAVASKAEDKEAFAEPFLRSRQQPRALKQVTIDTATTLENTR